jgi:hypothetical protein
MTGIEQSLANAKHTLYHWATPIVNIDVFVCIQTCTFIRNMQFSDKFLINAVNISHLSDIYFQLIMSLYMFIS